MRLHCPSRITRLALLAGGLACAAVSRPLAASTIFHEDFTGDSATNINGTAPDIRPGGEVWTASTLTGGAAPTLRTDGTIAASSAASAWLPVTLQSGHVYTLTVTADIVYQSSSVTPLGIGFTTDNPLSPAAVNLSNSGDYGILQVLRGGGWRFYAGPDNHPTNNSPTASAGNNTLFSSGTLDNYELRLVLDTSGANWTLAGYLGGSQLDLNGASAGLLYTYESHPTITGVGIHYGSSSFVFESLRFEGVAVVPEPASAAPLLGLGALVLVACRRRRRAGRSIC